MTQDEGDEGVMYEFMGRDSRGKLRWWGEQRAECVWLAKYLQMGEGEQRKEKDQKSTKDPSNLTKNHSAHVVE